jgi:RNA polymerase sigma-70 factor, ECF subfamily
MTNSDFENVVRRHQAMVYSIALHFFHNIANAEEVAQDVFLKLYQDRHSPKSELHTIAWLRRTTAHRCIDRLRREKVQREIQLDDMPDASVDSEHADPFLKERLSRLVASLPEKQRMVIILRYGEDMDVDEIGRTLQMPVRTVWSHLQRSLVLLREKASRFLRKEDYEPAGK